jgi:hypothetical protein
MIYRVIGIFLLCCSVALIIYSEGYNAAVKDINELSLYENGSYSSCCEGWRMPEFPEVIIND